jgi:hypothetical protein
MSESHLSPLGPKMVAVFRLSKRAGSHAERHTSEPDSEWGSIKAEPVWSSLTGAETALASMVGMTKSRDLESCGRTDEDVSPNTSDSGILSDPDRSCIPRVRPTLVVVAVSHTWSS